MLLVINITELFNQENISVAGRTCTEIVWLMLETKCRAFVTKIMTKPVPEKAGNFLNT